MTNILLIYIPPLIRTNHVTSTFSLQNGNEFSRLALRSFKFGISDHSKESPEPIRIHKLICALTLYWL